MTAYFLTTLFFCIAGIIAGGLFTLTRPLPKAAYANLWVSLVAVAILGTLLVNFFAPLIGVDTVHTIKQIVLFCVTFLFSSWFVDHR